MTRLLGLLLAALLACPAALAANPVSTENVTARLITERAAVAPGETVDLALVLDIRPGWHTYWENPGDSGEAPRIDWHLPAGVSADPIRWPYPDLIRVGPLANYGYSGRAVHIVALRIPSGWPAGQPVDLTADASWLVCEEHCVPESASLTLSLPTAAQPGPVDPVAEAIFAAARERLPRPFSGEVTIRRTADKLRLDLDAQDLPADVSKVWFFAGRWGLIEHPADQPWRLEGGRLELHLTPGPLGRQASPEGVLVVTSPAGGRAYAISPMWAAVPPAPTSVDAKASDLGLPLALGFALLGGIILNLMPCVFPVLAIKALSLATPMGPETRWSRASNGLAYTAGVLCFFAFVAAVLLGLRAAGENLGWGYQLQFPPFVAMMAYVFLALGLSLAGMVTVGTRLMGLGAVGPRAGILGAFATGALAALVAAPCTAPFMGAALGYAVTLPWPRALSIMLALGLGLALPYLVLALIPRASSILPKPGPWMEGLKQLLAFPMFATAAWLVWVLSVQAGPSGVAEVLSGALLLALGLWIWERSRSAAKGKRLLVAGMAIGAVATALVLGAAITPLESGSAHTVGKSSALHSEPFTPQALRTARRDGRPVFVNMTAAWCITCLVNERTALRSAAVARAFERQRVLYLKGDWTNRDPTITEYLAGFGRNGVPIYVYYPPGLTPHVLPQILTASLVVDAVGSRRRAARDVEAKPTEGDHE